MPDELPRGGSPRDRGDEPIALLEEEADELPSELGERGSASPGAPAPALVRSAPARIEAARVEPLVGLSAPPPGPHPVSAPRRARVER